MLVNAPGKCIPMESTRRRRWIVAAGIVLVVLLLVLAGSRTTVGRALVRTYLPWLTSSASAPAKAVEPPWPESVFNCEPATIGWVEPGTIIDRTPPDDWSHLVIRNDTRVVAGERGAQAERWNKLAEMFSLALLADVGRQEDHYFLARIATGWCHAIDGRETVITSATQAKLGAKLNALAAITLGIREVECDEHTRIVARSASTLVYDVERTLVFGEEHLSGHLRYALLVHPRTGELAAFLWIVPPAEVEAPESARIERLPPNFITTFALRFRAKGSGLLAMPAPDDYAVVDIPEGQSQLSITAAQRPVIYARTFDQSTALELEKLLRDAIGWQ